MIPEWATAFAFTKAGHFMAFEITPYVKDDRWMVNYGKSAVIYSMGIPIDSWKDTIMHRFRLPKD